MPSTGSSRHPGKDRAVDGHLCPSFVPRAPGKGVVFAIVAGTVEKPEVIPLEKPEPVTEEVFEIAAPHHPSEIFRIAAPCIEGRCKNFGNGLCHLVKGVLRDPAATEGLPACRIRPQCVWWHQEGKAACLRCPQIVTNNPALLTIRNAMKP